MCLVFLTYTPIQKPGVSKIIFLTNTFIQQGLIQLIKSNRKVV